ncbi:MAG: DUF1559 domain-containing protein [Planctomycetota bacterium]|nr:DUF1559 domain-containing protein [Planctomycetales bacterium]RLT09672.1 MAG: DUF1559 domain-containing protein [Planctomycetota bacterium]
MFFIFQGLLTRLPAPFVKGQPEIVSEDGLRGPQPGWYAVSVCMLKGVHSSVPEGDGEWTPSTENFTYFLNNFEPVDMIGYSIYIYHITEEDAARVRARESAQRIECGNKAKNIALAMTNFGTTQNRLPAAGYWGGGPNPDKNNPIPHHNWVVDLLP